MPLQDYGRYMGGMADLVQSPVNAFYGAQDDAVRNKLNTLRAQQMQGELDDDAEWDAAYARKDWDTLRRLDPQTTELLSAHEQRKAMAGLEDISVTAKPIDEKAVFDRGMKEREFAADERNRKAQLGVQWAQFNASQARQNEPEKAPSGYRWKPDGSLEVIPGGPAANVALVPGEVAPTGNVSGFGALPPGMKLTEVQGKNYLGASIMAENIPVLSAAIKKGYKPTRQDLFAVGPPLKGFWNSLGQEVTPRESANPQANDFYNAGSKILTAILRPESGGAITEDEWTMYGPMYLPWPGDDEATIKRKMVSLNSYMQRLAQVSGPAAGYFTGAKEEENVIDLPPPGGR